MVETNSSGRQLRQSSARGNSTFCLWLKEWESAIPDFTSCPDPPFSNSLCIVLSPVAVADSGGFGEYIKKYTTREECHGPAWAALPSLCSHSTSCVSKEGGDGGWDRPYHFNFLFGFPSAFLDVEHDPWPSALTVPVLKELGRSVEGHRHRIFPDHKNRLERMWWHGPWRWECGYSTPYFIN